MSFTSAAITDSIRLFDISTYSGFNSIPMYSRLCFLQTTPVVPAPLNGSRTVSPMDVPASMQGSIRSSGNVAKCASGYGFVETVQTSRLFLVPLGIYIYSQILFYSMDHHYIHISYRQILCLNRNLAV